MTREQCAQLGEALVDFVALDHDDAWFGVTAWFGSNPTPGGDLNIWERDGEILAAVYPLRTNDLGAVETATNCDPVWVFAREGWR